MTTTTTRLANSLLLSSFLFLISLEASTTASVSGKSKRHTPFMPEDHWKGRPDFGRTDNNVTVMVNGTAELRCPIAKVQDSAVSAID